MSIRLLHLADLHLGAPLAYLCEKAEERSQELEAALWRALALVPEKGVHAVLIAGDLFDKFNPPAHLVARVKAELERVAAGGVPIILIPGTHDSHRYTRCVYRHEAFPGVDIMLEPGPVCKHLNGRQVYFYGYTGTEGRGAFRRAPEHGLHIALVHGSVGEQPHWTPGRRDFALREEDLETAGFDYVALGHYHNLREFRRGKTLALYPGTLEGLKFGENGDRYMIIVEVDESGASIEKIRHNRRSILDVEIDLSLIQREEDLVKAIERHAGPDVIARVTLTGSADFFPKAHEIEARLGGGFFHLEILDRTTLYRSELVRAIMGENTVRGIFARKMLERIENCSGEERAAAELALRLGIEQFIRLNDENK